ncbi:MAG: hypothetical protein GTN70_06775 [Deltaproteobacteria bacterium]|nr:hypothetical protein [Deltaproteobacteria bacterium]NIS77399.1 hypothetical protein [Deltaproteobacteria bacterium]
MKKLKKFLPAVLLVTLISAGLIYCGGGGGGGSTTAAPEAINFTPSNMEGAAGLVTLGSELYYELSQVVLAMVDPLLVAAPMAPAAVIPVGDLGLCVNSTTGTSDLSLDDVDNSLDLSVGDSATLTITNCQLLDPTDLDTSNGTLILTFVAIDLVSSQQTITADVALNVDVNPVDSFIANFRMQVTTTDWNTFNISVTALDGNDIIVLNESGQTFYQLGCFDVALNFTLSIPGIFTLIEEGVINVPGAGIMSFSNLSQLVFVPGPYPDEGATRIDSGGTCAALGAPDGASGADGSYIIFTAVPDDFDDITLELYDSSDTLLVTVDTFYGNL